MKKLIFVSILLLFGLVIQAQGDSKWPPIDVSPMEVIYYPANVAWRNYLKGEERNANPKMKLIYSRPQKKGRQIFGGLIAFGSDWRLGANEATTISFYQAIGIGDQTLQAGTYTIAATVNESEWTINISTETGIWGIANRDEDQIVAKMTVPTELIESTTESLSMTFQEVSDKEVDLIIQWENTRAKLPINLNPIQFNQLDVSPMDMTHYPANSAYTNYLKGNDQEIKPKITVNYHRPAKKDRQVFGELVPYGKVWRLGANESTEIVLHQKSVIQEVTVEPGRYALYAEVEQEHWNLILSKDIPAWGDHNRDLSKDVATIKIPAFTEEEVVEHLSIIFEENEDDSVNMIVAWDQTRAKAHIAFE